MSLDSALRNTTRKHHHAPQTKDNTHEEAQERVKNQKRRPRAPNTSRTPPENTKPDPGQPSIDRYNSQKNTCPSHHRKTPPGPARGHFLSNFDQKTTKTKAQRNVAERFSRPRGTFLRAFDPAYRQKCTKPLKASKTDFSIF